MPRNESGNDDADLSAPCIESTKKMKLAREDRERIATLIQEKIEHREGGKELPVLLEKGRVGVIVPDHFHAGRGERRYVEISASCVSGDVAAGGEMTAQIDQTLVAAAADAELGGPISRRCNAERLREPFDDREVQIDEARPWPLEDFAQPRQVGLAERRARVELLESRQLLAPPALPVVYLDLEDRLRAASAVQHRHGKPDRALGTFHLVAIAPTMLVELHVVIMHEHVRFFEQIEISQPRQITRLQHHERGHDVLLRRP